MKPIILKCPQKLKTVTQSFTYSYLAPWETLSNGLDLLLAFKHFRTHTHTYTHTYIYMLTFKVVMCFEIKKYFFFKFMYKVH